MTRRFVACGRQTCAVPLKLTLQIVRRPDGLHTFQFLPRRWVVERTLAWIIRCRRTVRDYERLTAHLETMLHWAMIIVMTRRLACHPRPGPRSSHPAFTRKGALNPGRASESALAQAGWPVLCPLSAEAGATVAATSR